MYASLRSSRRLHPKFTSTSVPSGGWPLSGEFPPVSENAVSRESQFLVFCGNTKVRPFGLAEKTRQRAKSLQGTTLRQFCPRGKRPLRRYLRRRQQPERSKHAAQASQVSNTTTTTPVLSYA